MNIQRAEARLGRNAHLSWIVCFSGAQKRAHKKTHMIFDEPVYRLRKTRDRNKIRQNAAEMQLIQATMFVSPDQDYIKAKSPQADTLQGLYLRLFCEARCFLQCYTERAISKCKLLK